MNAAKTPITVLQEMLVKMGQVPEYECIAQSGPEHLASFEFRCVALGAVVSGKARSKKEAKQEAARHMLSVLAARGEPVPPPYCLQQPAPTSSTSSEPRTAPTTAAVNQYSYVALLKDLCMEYHLPNVEYELVGDSGPPHLRMFTMRARLGQHERLATASSKKAARQQAAEQLYTYMRENLARLTKDFVEEDAIVRARERAMERYLEAREEQPWRPDLGQRLADYHLDLVTHIEPEKCELARQALEGIDEDGVEYECSDDDDDEAVANKVAAAVSALGLTLTVGAVAGSAQLWLVELAPTSPALAFAARSPAAAHCAALRYLRLALSYAPVSH